MKLCMSKQVATAVLLLLIALSAFADSVYQSPEEFIAEVFADNVPATQVLWVTAELRDEARAILGHELAGLRIRYWQVGSRSAWILDEIGKDLPITVGVIVERNYIRNLRVLTYRENRGGEVTTPAFTDQFDDVALAPGGGLDTHIDGITGATLSVQALTRLAAVALFLHKESNCTNGP